ncbi:hypothetical protein [Thermomonospora cellulosilytica]|uniref:Uncharacterized protein n=1 Tax=Thermomonospora cellulosilytica TaxID=1411118 RepID=A0A7W3R6T8_9ACTN|nr:hypothetical protein [Thermomonospora cellulosilytica]MBA9001665.1 hypothetical protein [Thermomonospora cellulosilytica]
MTASGCESVIKRKPTGVPHTRHALQDAGEPARVFEVVLEAGEETRAFGDR